MGAVGLAVEGAGDECDGAAWDDFGEEDDAATAGAVGEGAAHVEAEIDLGEAGVARDAEAEDTDVVEEEADEGDEAARLGGWVGGVGVEIELEGTREVRDEDLGWDLVLGHDELAPVGGEEGSGHGIRLMIGCGT